MLQYSAVETLTRMRPVTQQDELRGIVRDWLEAIQQKYNVKPRGIATRANVSPSTIYRWLDEAAPFVMSMSKLKQVADAFGEALPEGLTGSQPAHRPGFAESDLVSFISPISEIPAKPAINHGRYQITNEVLDLEGFRPGDILDFDMAIKPTAGDIVVAQVYNLQRGSAETVLRIFQPPYLLTRSSDRRIDTRPLYVDNERVAIVGTFVRMTRERAA